MCLELVRQFRKDMREAQLRAKLPRFVSQHVCADVPVANVRVTSAGIVRLLPAEAEVQQASAAGEEEIQADTFEDEEPFLADCNVRRYASAAATPRRRKFSFHSL